MGTRDLFSKKIVSSKNFQDELKYVESSENVEQQIIKKNRFIPDLDYATASNFSHFGSAKEYYIRALENIADSYPYDGSKKEITQFLNESSYVDLYIFENKYPRHNGYVNFSSNGWGSLIGTQINGLGSSSNTEYIYFRGGPNTASVGMENKPIYKTFDYSNKYETEVYNKYGELANGRVGSRESNLKTNFDNGVTIEYWLKKEAFDNTKTETEIIFDLWNGIASGTHAGVNENSGRLIIAVNENGANPSQGLTLVIQSGSVSSTQNLDVPVSTITDGNWHHYAVVLQNVNSSLVSNIYVDGQKVASIPEGTISSLGEITGSLAASIGASQTIPPFNEFHDLTGIYGKLSGSIDEFRFWKSARTQEEIILNYNSQVGGGTNTDISNTELGVYFKFNEGITGTSSIDSRILDYSGRITNGNWIGYPGSSARSTGSAFVESGKSLYEFKDPVIYKNHPKYKEIYTELLTEGEVWDSQNSAMLINTLPGWISLDDIESNRNLTYLTQIMGSVFDTLYIQTQEINKIKSNSYGRDKTYNLENMVFSGSKQNPNNSILLDSYGMNSEELFSNQTLIEYISNKNLYKEYSTSLEDIKNTIYKNIYNNLIKIFKSKGTSKSIRNLLRCMGLDDKIIKTRLYSNNNEFLFDNRYSEDVKFKKYLNFNSNGSHSSLVFMSASLDNTENQKASSVSGSYNIYNAFTSEVNVRIPNRQESINKSYYVPTFLSSSIFGIHQTSSNLVIDYPIGAANDSNFEVYAVKTRFDETEGKFLLKDRLNTFNLTSSIIKGLYDNTEWNLAVRVYNNKYPYSSTGSVGIDYPLESDSVRYYLDFVGYCTEGSILRDSFTITQEITALKAKQMLTGSLRYYAGAHRENITGSLLQSSDIQVGYIRHYSTFVDNEALLVHAYDRDNFGVLEPTKNKYLFSNGSKLSASYVPEHVHLLFNVDFETVTGSDANGKFKIVDFSSGSVALNNRYPGLRNTNAIQYEFTGYGFPANSLVPIEKEFVLSSRLTLPEEITDDNFVQVLNRDDELFTRDNAVFSSALAIEKSYYGAISEEIINFFGGIVAFNDLIGEVANKYRDDYKSLKYFKTIFFEHFGEMARIERFYSYYKWVDDSIINFISQLVPESVAFDKNIRDVIESHILERHKVKYQYPMFDYYGNTRFAEPNFEGNINSVKDFQRKWKFEHPPIGTTSQNVNSQWWKNIASRKEVGLKTGNTTVDTQRDLIKNSISNDSIISRINRATVAGVGYKELASKTKHLPENVLMSIEKQNGLNSLTAGPNSKFGKNIDVFREKVATFTKTRRSAITLTKENSVDIVDDSEIQKNVKINMSVRGYVDQDNKQVTDDYYFDNAENISPISFVSESRNSSDLGGYQAGNAFKHQINNIHGDYVGHTLEISMQAPFTEEHVGGNQHRHQGMQKTPVSPSSLNGLRAEQFKITRVDADNVRLISPQALESSTDTRTDAPYSVYYRDETAKRPVNLRNIKYTTGSYAIGNYQKDLEIISMNGRTTNNRAFIKSEGFSTASVTSGYINNMVDYTKPIRTIANATNSPNKSAGTTEHIIVSRFSSPGGPETAGDSQGGAGLDYEAAEFSPYNNLNYRNLSVRQILNRTFLTQTSYKFGLASGSSVQPSSYYNSGSINSITASFNKTFRNGRRILTQDNISDFTNNLTYATYSYDNAFIGSNIPATDYQYSWITASYVSSSILNYIPSDGYTSSSIGKQLGLTYLSSSDLGSAISAGVRVYGITSGQSGYTNFIPDTFTSLKFNVRDPHDENTLVTGYSLTENVNKYLTNSATSSATTAYVLNGLLNSRNGPYGYSSFRQIRVGQTKVAENLRAKNIFSLNLDRGDKKQFLTYDGSGNPITETIVERYGQLAFSTQSVYVNKFSGVDFYLVSRDKLDQRTSQVNKQNVSLLRAELGNQKIYFSGDNLNESLGLKKIRKSAAETVMEAYSNSTDLGIYELKYKERVYPNEINEGSKKFRVRSNFDNNFWRDNHSDRLLKGLKKRTESIARPGFSIGRSSWNLDPYYEFVSSATPNPPTIHADQIQNLSPAGILQNWTTYNRAYESAASTTKFEPASSLTPEPLLSRPHMELFGRSIVSRNGMKILINNNTVELKNLAVPTHARIPFLSNTGYAKWQAAEQSEKQDTQIEKEKSLNINTTRKFVKTNRKPFYDTYKEFSEDIEKLGRDMTLLPEYRASLFSDVYLNKAKNLTNLPEFLKIEGSQEANNSNDPKFFEIYSNSDFMKYFNVVRNKNKNSLVNDSVTLECNVLKKFIPYDGFYPSERTVDIAKEFFKSYGNESSISSSANSDQISDTNNKRPILQTLFAPGILFNTIKSGIAVDYPIYTGSFSVYPRYFEPGGSDFENYLGDSFHNRVPFETIYKPSLLNGLTIFDNEPLNRTNIGNTASTRLRNKINISDTNTNYVYAINNFLAETQEFFVEDASIKSVKETEFDTVVPGNVYGMRIKLYKSLENPLVSSGSWGDYPIPQASASIGDPPVAYILANKALFQGTQRVQGDTFRGDFEGLNTLTASITIRNNTTGVERVIIGTGSNTAGPDQYTNYVSHNTFKIDSSRNLNNAGFDTNLRNTMIALTNAINYSDLGISGTGSTTPPASFRAIYLGEKLLRSDSLNDDITGRDGIFYSGEENPENYTYGIIKIIGSTFPYENIRTSLSMSARTNFSHESVSQFMILTSSIPDYIRPEYFTSSLTLPSSGFVLTSSMPFALEKDPRETITMYSRPTAFGPPVAGITGSTGTNNLFYSAAYDSANGYNTAFTPPYYYGEAWLDILYIPPGSKQQEDYLAGNTSVGVAPYRPSIKSNSDGKNLFSFASGSSNGSTVEEGIHIRYWRYDKANGTNTSKDDIIMMRDDLINFNSMQLSASILPFEIEFGNSQQATEVRNTVLGDLTRQTVGGDKWIIKPKFQTPILNFSHLTSSNEVYYPGSTMSGSVPRGIWHQFGRIPDENEGIYMKVENLPSNWLNNHPTGSKAMSNGGYCYPTVLNKPLSLASICKFPTEPVKLGRVKKTKKIREAVVAVPFVQNGDTKNFFLVDKSQAKQVLTAIDLINTIYLSRNPNKELLIGTEEFISFAKEINQQGDSITPITLNGNQVSVSTLQTLLSSGLVDTINKPTSVSEMFIKMRNYNFPPQFDFINNRDIDPIAMYIFEFEHTLNQDDLSHIWQNLMPELGVKAEKSSSTISHYLLTNELMGNRSSEQQIVNTDYSDIDSKVQWMVFKVKQKALKDYSRLIKGEAILPDDEKQFAYNWPYDYFSFVELASISSEIGFKSKRTQQETNEQPILSETILGLLEPDNFNEIPIGTDPGFESVPPVGIGPSPSDLLATLPAPVFDTEDLLQRAAGQGSDSGVVATRGTTQTSGIVTRGGNLGGSGGNNTGGLPSGGGSIGGGTGGRGT